MNSDNLIEKPGVSDGKEPTDSGRRTETAIVFEMGSVLGDTKGFLRGLELGFTPRSG